MGNVIMLLQICQCIYQGPKEACKLTSLSCRMSNSGVVSLVTSCRKVNHFTTSLFCRGSLSCGKRFLLKWLRFPEQKCTWSTLKIFKQSALISAPFFFISGIKLHKGRKSPLKAVQWPFNFYSKTNKFSCYIPTSLISSLYCTCKHNNVENVFMPEDEKKRNFTQDLFVFCWPGKKLL